MFVFITFIEQYKKNVYISEWEKINKFCAKYATKL